jgi:hypothetical protein
VGDLRPCAAATDLRKLHEAADLAGAVRWVAVDRDALLPGSADDSHPGFSATRALLF